MSESLNQNLIGLSREEINHANILTAGRNYVLNAPDMFERETISIAEMDQGLEKINSLLLNLEKNSVTLVEALRKMYELESIYEQAHLKTIIAVKDESLKRLFEALSRGDEEHKKKLDKIIKVLAIKQAV